jgi:3-oxoacyl-[acyl-carrier protein] reductase
MRLENKVALVTGAGRGIGKAIVTRLAEEGASVVINDIDVAFAENMARQFKKLGYPALASGADVSKWQDVEQMFEEAASRFKGIDILVNNAGIRKDAPLHKIGQQDWDSALSVQLEGCFACSRSAQKYMVDQNSGKIVNMSSPVPVSLGERGQTGYAAASAAIEGFTKALALELGRYNINVNCIAPDYIDTEMNRDAAKNEGMYINDLKKFAVAGIPLKRLGTPKDVADVALFLVSDESSYVTGQTITVKGGP